VTSTQSSSGRLFGFPKGRTPPRDKEWFVADVVVENRGPGSIDVESLIFTLTSRDSPSPMEPSSHMIATDRSSGVDMEGVIGSRGRMAMSVAFPVAADDRDLQLTLRVADTKHKATAVLR
jgi:hypothetical protein